MAQRNYSATATERSLSAGVNSTDTTLGLSAGGNFPAPPFTIAVDPGTSSMEVMLVTAVAGNNHTVTRGYDGTAAVPHGAGAVVQHVHSAIDFREANLHGQKSTDVHGVGTGDVVGTTKAQTLTAKTINLSSNTVTGTVSQFNAAVSDGSFATTQQLTTTNNSISSLGSRVTTAENDIDALEELLGPVSVTIAPLTGWTGVTVTGATRMGGMLYVQFLATTTSSFGSLSSVGTVSLPPGLSIVGTGNVVVGEAVSIVGALIGPVRLNRSTGHLIVNAVGDGVIGSLRAGVWIQVQSS